MVGSGLSCFEAGVCSPGIDFFFLIFTALRYRGTRSQKQLVFATARYYKADYCTVEVSRDHSECGGGRAQRFQVGGDRCETSVAETVGRRRTSRPTSLPFCFRSERFNPAGKRGTLALVTRRPLQLWSREFLACFS